LAAKRQFSTLFADQPDGTPAALLAGMHRFWLGLLSLTLLLAPRAARAVTMTDSWLPGANQVGATVATGIPFLITGELSLGVTDHAAIGVLGGATPTVSGFGARPRGAIPFSDDFRLLLSAPFIYYPRHSDGPAWWLTRPSAALEWRPSNRWRVGVGGGGVGIATHDALFGGDAGDTTSSAYGRQFHNRNRDLWWTLNALASLAVSERSNIFADATCVFRGYEPVRHDWIGKVPLFFFLGVSTKL
jgi:hypothetical protein